MTLALDAPWSSPPATHDLIAEAMTWHFDPATGSRYWLERAKTLDFDPRRDVRTEADLRLFPNIVDELREIPVEDLVPRGYTPADGVPKVGESGGTTGTPKRVFVLPDVQEQSWTWYYEALQKHGIPHGANWLGMVPTGPHMVGSLVRDTADRFGGVFFSADLDPRWVKRCVARGAGEVIKQYVEHLVDQMEWVLRTQDIGVVALTPPLINAVCRRDGLVELINEKVTAITWSGASLDEDTRELLRTEVFPEVSLIGIFGSTMIFCGIPERVGLPPGEPAVFDPPSPYSMFQVIDPDTGEPVPHGQRGQVVTHHITRNLLLPNNLERDTAIRHPHGLGMAGDALSEVKPVEEFGDRPVVEGVY